MGHFDPPQSLQILNNPVGVGLTPTDLGQLRANTDRKTMKKMTKRGVWKFASFLPTLYFLVLSFSLVGMALVSNASFMGMTSNRNIKIVIAAIFCLLGEFNL